MSPNQHDRGRIVRMPAEKQSFGEGHRDEVNRAKQAGKTTRTSYIRSKRLNYVAEGAMVDENESPDSHKSGDFEAHLCQSGKVGRMK